MESTSTSTKVDVMRPVLLKAGIPLAITVAGFIFARIATRKCPNLPASTAEKQKSPHGNQEGEGCSYDLQSLESTSLSCLETDHFSTDTSQQNSEEDLLHQHISELEEENSVLKSRVKDLRTREFELETQYLHYHDMKEQELLLVELQNKLLLEITRVEFLDKEISSMEAERLRFENMVFEYLKILEALEIYRSRTRLLQRKVKKLLRKNQKHSRVIKQQSMQIEAKGAEISRNHQELEAKARIIRKREDDIEELKTNFGQLQMEKNELLTQIELANTAASSKVQVGGTTLVDYGQVVTKLEQLEKEHALKIKELVYLRWCNACLRHELMRKNEEQQEHLQQRENQTELNFGEASDFGSDNEHNRSSWHHGDSCLLFPTTGHSRDHPKRQKFIEKFKRWVERSEKTKQKINEKEKHKVRHLDRHSLPDSTGDLHNPARKSYSSA